MGPTAHCFRLAGLVRPLRMLGAAAIVLLPALARADYRETVSLLRIGLVESHAAAADPVKLEAIRQAFAAATGISVEIVKLPNFAALVDSHASGRVGYAIHSAKSFAATQAVCGCVRAFRNPVAADGSTGFRSVLVVRASTEKPLTSLNMAYSNEGSVSGWQIPQQAFGAGSLERPVMVRAGSVGSLIALYRTGEVDGFFGWLPYMPGESGSDLEKLFGGWMPDQHRESEPLRLIWSSEPVPYGPHAVHQSVPADLVDALGSFLDAMPASAPGLLDIFEPNYAGGFATPGPEDYRNVRNLVEPASPSMPLVGDADPAR